MFSFLCLGLTPIGGSIDDIDLATLGYQATFAMVRQQLEVIPVQRTRRVRYAYNGCAVCTVWVTRHTYDYWTTDGQVTCDVRRCDPKGAYGREQSQ